MYNKFRKVDCTLFQRDHSSAEQINSIAIFQIHLLIKKFYNRTTVIQSPTIAIPVPALTP